MEVSIGIGGREGEGRGKFSRGREWKGVAKGNALDVPSALSRLMRYSRFAATPLPENFYERRARQSGPQSDPRFAVSSFALPRHLQSRSAKGGMRSVLRQPRGARRAQLRSGIGSFARGDSAHLGESERGCCCGTRGQELEAKSARGYRLIPTSKF